MIFREVCWSFEGNSMNFEGQGKDDGIEGMPRELRTASQRCGNFEEIVREPLGGLNCQY